MAKLFTNKLNMALKKKLKTIQIKMKKIYITKGKKINKKTK